MNKSSCIKYLLSFVFAISSCTGYNIGEENGIGYIDIAVSHDTAVQIVPVVKSSQEQQLPVTLTIYDAQGTVCQRIEDYTNSSSVLSLPTGRYSAEAVVGIEPAGGISYSPYYTGSTEFEIKANVVASADIICRLASVKVTASVSDQIKSNFSYCLEITDGRSVETFTNSISEAKELYFPVSESLSWTLTLTNTDNEVFVLNDTYTSLLAGQYYNLVFSLNTSDSNKIGAGEFKIVLDDSFNAPKEHDVTLVIDKSAPAIDGPSEVIKSISDICSEGIYTVTSVLPINSLSITHSDSQLLTLGLPQNTDLFTDRSALGLLADAGVSIEIFSGTAPLPFVDDETTEVRLDFNSLYNNLPVGEYAFTITSENLTGKNQVLDVVVKVSPSLSQPALEPWAKFIYVKGRWASTTRPEGLKLQYRLSGRDAWTDFVPSAQTGEIFYDDAKGTFRAFVCGLTAKSTYQVRIVTDRESLDAQSVTTAAAEQLYNMSFDEWSDNSTPYASGKEGVWDTANPGTSLLSITPTTKSSDVAVRGSVASVRMESMYKTKFAAGNIYTGQFDEINMIKMGAELDWGCRFTSKPLGMKGYYKYEPKTIDYTGGNYGGLKGQMDKCQIQIALFTNWTERFHVVTYNNKFVDFSSSNKDIVAHNVIEDGTTNGKWVPFTLYSGYRKDTFRKTPTYIVTTACASYRGDYFTGGKGSTLYVDEFEYVYDPMELNAQDRAKFFGLFD